MRATARWLALFLCACSPDEGLAPVTVTVLYPAHEAGAEVIDTALRQGILQAHVGSNFTLEEQTTEGPEQVKQLLDEALAPRQGRRLVITAGSAYAAAIDARNCALNGTQVLQLMGSPRPCASLRSVELQLFGPAFQAGVVAVSAESVSPRRSAGIVFMPPWTLDDALIRGFVRGAEFAGGHVQTLALPQYDDAPEDAAAIRAQIQELIDAVDVLLVAGDVDTPLLLDAVNAHNAQNPTELLRLIVVDQDLSLLDAKVALGSIVRRFDVEVRLSILDAVVDAFSPGQVLRGFRDGQTELLINPTYAEVPLEVEPFAACEACATLDDALAAAEAAGEAAEAEDAE